MSKGQLPDFNNLVLWKSYFKKENTWKLILVIQHLLKFIHTFYKYCLDKTIAISSLVNSTPPMMELNKLIKSLKILRKYDQPAKDPKANK